MRINQSPVKPRFNEKKSFSFKWLFAFIFLTSVVVGLLILISLESPDPRVDKPFFDHDRPLVIAHQGGNLLKPGNTLTAFEHAEQLGVDVIEFDIHMTKDGHLVAIHDDTVDATTNGTGRVDEMTLDEIQALDAGYHFKDLNGDYSYRGQGVYIPTVEEVFEQFGHLRMNIEIKDAYPLGEPSTIETKLWELIQQYEMEDKVLVASFDDDIIKRFQVASNHQVAVSGGRSEVTKFVILHYLFLDKFYEPTVDAFQVPLEQRNINLTNERLINGAQNLNVHYHFWTINDEETMRSLLQKGADGIITDRPDLLVQIMNEMYD